MSSEGAASSIKPAIYCPNIWEDNFFTNLSHFKKTDDSLLREKHDEMEQEIRRMLQNNTDDPTQKLKLINIVQRLGIAYHFKTEIEDQLTKICNINSEDYHNDLCNVALRFRLLRQQGIKVSCDVFEKFKDKDGKFKESLIEDIEGLLSLYEAAFLSIRGEDILDEAIDFTTKNLQLILPKLSPNLAEEVAYALNRPIHKNLPRLGARHFIATYEVDKSHNKTLAKFAKLDFNMLQEQHQKELKGLIVWWKICDFSTKLPYARDRIFEIFFCMMGVYFEPQYCVGRKMIIKVASMFSIIDDTFDNYAKTQDLEPFTQAIQRWDVGAIDAFPEYMQMIFHCFNDVVNEIDEIATREGRSFCVYYAKELMKKVIRHFLIEAKWREENYIPTVDEYMEVSKVTTCSSMMATTSFIGMGEIATKETFEWIFNGPKIMEASTIICRLMNDIVSHEFEQEREHVASGIDCYVKQYKVSEEEVIKLFRKDIANAWKDMNEECLRPTPVAMEILERILNLSRAMDVIYKDGDGYTNPHVLKDYVALLIKDPIL